MTAFEPVHEGDGRVARGDARRELILNAAVREFGRKGYDATRVADIAREAGLTDAGVLHHFSSKSGLFLAAVDYRRETLFEVPPVMPLTVRTLFDAMIDTVRRSVEHPELLLFRAMLSSTYRIEGNPLTGRDSAILAARLQSMTPIVQTGIESGEIEESVDAEQIVFEILALNDGVRNQWVALPDRVDYLAVFTTAVNSIYERVRRR